MSNTSLNIENQHNQRCDDYQSASTILLLLINLGLFSVVSHYVVHNSLGFFSLFSFGVATISVTVFLDYLRITWVNKQEFEPYLMSEGVHFYMAGTRIPFFVSFLIMGTDHGFGSTLMFSLLILSILYTAGTTIWVTNSGKRTSVIERQAILATIPILLIPNMFFVFLLSLFAFYF